jgi:FkbM family methyltransferase
MATVGGSANRTRIVPLRTGVLSAFVRWYLRSGLRGSTRCTFAFARRLKTLHAVPIVVNQRQQLWIDLRDGLSHLLLAGSPWATVPWESDEQVLMRRLVRPGDIVFDIGAHIGLHTVLLSELAGSTGVVHAFEPNAGKATALSRTVAALPNANLHAVALGESEGCVALYIPEDESMASLADWTYGREWNRRRTTCEVKRLDDLVARGALPAPDFIKCDVEGGELAVLHGGAAMLDRAEAPIVLYEVNQWAAQCFGLSMSAATDFLRSLSRAKYSIFYAQDSGRALTPYDNPELGDCFNLIAIPASRLDRLTSSAPSAGLRSPFEQ